MKASLPLGVAAVGLLLGLTACEGIKEQFGLNKQPPDEFRIQAQAPLSMPPDFNLRPPQQGAARPQEGTAQQQARRAVFRAGESAGAAANGTSAGAGRSPGERALLAAAGVARADPNIRATVDRESGLLNEQDKSFLDFLVFWRDPDPSGTVVDADKEAKRLRENAALGKDVTEGETPTIERRKKGLFEGLF
jgi:hypothetical protein